MLREKLQSELVGDCTKDNGIYKFGTVIAKIAQVLTSTGQEILALYQCLPWCLL